MLHAVPRANCYKMLRDDPACSQKVPFARATGAVSGLACLHTVMPVATVCVLLEQERKARGNGMVDPAILTTRGDGSYRACLFTA